MLRDKALIPLSRQHQHALALCVRIDRASPIADADVQVFLAETNEQFNAEIRVHFAAEESVVFPAARKFAELTETVNRLCNDHAQLREEFALAEAGTMTSAQLVLFGRRLSAHIRNEERELFEELQRLMSTAELGELGAKLEEALRDATQTCTVPGEASRGKSRK